MLALVIVAAAVWFVVIPQAADARSALAAGKHIQVPLLALAVVLEALSLFAFSGLTLQVLDQTQPRFATLLRIDLADLATNHIVPGGGATAAAVRYRLLRTAGVDGDEAIAVATIETALSNTVLVALFVMGLVLTITSSGPQSDDVLALVVAGILLLGVLGLSWLLVRRTQWCVRAAQFTARFVPGITAFMAAELVRTFASRIRLISHDRRRLRRAISWATVNWSADAACLGVLLTALGWSPNLGVLLTVYGLGSILAMLPLTPGGLGIVEGIMVPAFTGLGVPGGIALVGVLAWRLLEYWCPIPVGGIAYLSLKVGPFRLQRR